MSSTASRGEPSSSGQRGGSVSRKRSNAGSSRHDERMIGQWRIGRTIGKGSSGRVKIAKHAITGKYAAIKIVPKGQIISSRLSVSEAGARADKVLLGIEREIVIMKLIDHPNVLNLYDVWETSSELYLIMEYVPGGELFDYLVKRGRLPVSEALHYFQQIIHAVDYCHRFNICHRDLKPENLLLDRDKNIKVADFGMAAWEAGERMLETSCGSPHYASPEIVAGKAYHGSSSDIWSCGIILFALLTGRLPFDDDNIRSLLQKVKTGIFEMPDEIKNPARDLLSKMLEKDPERRITMPEILQHPFFTSRAPRPIPGRALVSPPTLDEVERPVNSPEEIDEDIMGNLKTLWSGATDDEIVGALMSKDKTWEKAIYHLLVKYRSKHLENYNMDESEDEAARQRRAARKAQAHMFAPNVASPPKRKGSGAHPAPAGPARKQPLGENETLQESVEPNVDVATPIKRPNAPTPKKASTQPTYESPLPSRPQSSLTPRPPMGPRAQSHRGTGAESPIPATPAIVLQEATPTKEMLPPAVIPSRPGSALASPSLGADSNLPPLNVPQVNDEQLQHFFNEVAAQLNTMNIRSSVVSTGSSASSNILGSDYHTYLSYINAGNPSPSPTPGLPATNEEEALDFNQFADADDDETEAVSVHSMAMSAMSPMTQHSPLAGLGLGGPPIGHGARPQLYPAPANPNRWSYASSASSARGASVSSYPSESPQLYSPAISYAEPVTPAIATLVPSPIATRPSNPLPLPPTHMQAQRAAPLPPRTASRAPPPPPVNVALANAPRRSGELQRDGSYMIITHADTPSVEYASQSSRQSSSSASSRAQDAFGMLVKKKKKVSIDPVAYSPTLAGPSSAMSTSSGMSGASGQYGSGVASPKRSWFGNLFSFKPAAVTVSSHQNISASREMARKVLGELGVRSSTVEIDGMRALKCRFDDVVGANGSVIVKGVRFRVEFTRASSPSANGSFGTSISLTQEKGAQSSFQHIYQSLKTSFEDPLAGSAPYRAASYSAPSSTAQVRRPVTPHTHSYPAPASTGNASAGLLSPIHSPRSAFSPATSPKASTFTPGQATLQAPGQSVQWATPTSPRTPHVPSTARFGPTPPSPQPPRSPRVPVPIRS